MHVKFTPTFDVKNNAHGGLKILNYFYEKIIGHNIWPTIKQACVERNSYEKMLNYLLLKNHFNAVVQFFIHFDLLIDD